MSICHFLLHVLLCNVLFIVGCSTGYGRQMDETMVDKVMMWCDTDLDSTQTSKGRADVVLLNSAMDAYIR